MSVTSRFQLLVIFLLLCACSSCSGHSLKAPEGTGGTGGAIQADAAPEGIAAVLPSPSELLPLLGSEKQTSYSEDDYISHGREYLTILPNQNVSIAADSARFDTNWSAATAFAPAELGFCCYRFENLSGYARETELRCGWQDPPDDSGTAWLGLANWDSDAWDWHQCGSSGIWTLASFDPYTSPVSEMVAVMVMANAEVSELRWIRLGPPLVNAELHLDPATGLAPLEVILDASASTTDVGSIARYEWDTDESGTFADDTGATSTFEVITGIVGPYQYAVRVTSDYGTQDTAVADYFGYSPWAHSWGGNSGDKIFGVATDDAGFIYAAGATPSFGAGITNGLILKYDLDGNLVWAKAWSFEKTDSFNDILVDANGDLIVVGESYSSGPNGSDALIQKWDRDGNVLWSYVWGGSATDQATAVARHEDQAYVTGNTDSFGAGWKDVMLLKLGPDGSLDWQRVWGGASGDYAEDVSAWKFALGLTCAYIVGSTSSFGAGEDDVLYLRFTEVGDLTTQRCWGNADNQRGTCVSVSGLLTSSVFIGGHTGGYIDRDFLLLEVGGSLARTWGSDKLDQARGILRTGDSLVLSGESNSFSSKDDGLLVNFGTDGIFESAELFGTPAEQEGFIGMSWFPGRGLVLGGYAVASQDCVWSTPVGTVADVFGTWEELAEVPDTPSASLTSRSGTVTDITTATVDTGGGVVDALIAAHRIPFW